MATTENLEVIIDKRADTQWRKSDKSYNNYKIYIGKKANRYALSLIDLLYVSNFKGGNATIDEDQTKIDDKLKSYSVGLCEINKAFNNKALAGLDDEQLNTLISKVTDICDLTRKDDTRIDGFSASRLSALLHIYFPELIPILDRRVLINLELVSEKDKDSQQQIKHIQNFYPDLIRKFAKISKEKEGQGIRSLDREYFKIEIKEGPKLT